jgi:signal transduction histidine kinase
MARGIYPVSISADSLAETIETLVRNMNRLCNDIIVFDGDQEITVSDADTATHLYRITQEALSNAMRHANASRIRVAVEQDDERIAITVADDGAGSSIQKRPEGMGWHTMRYRANVIGATIAVQSSSSKGTTVRCTLPNVPAVAPATEHTPASPTTELVATA